MTTAAAIGVREREIQREKEKARDDRPVSRDARASRGFYFLFKARGGRREIESRWKEERKKERGRERPRAD